MIPDRDKVQRSSVTSVERDARLVEQLVISLRAQQQKNGAWPGDDLSHTLRNTCHALEALYLLGSATFPRIIANGVHWLLNLADEIDADSSAWISIRLHPSRFKTLARLREFQDEKLQEDFAELCERIGEDGLLNKVLVDQLLGSLIVMDNCYQPCPLGQASCPTLAWHGIWRQFMRISFAARRPEIVKFCTTCALLVESFAISLQVLTRCLLYWMAKPPPFVYSSPVRLKNSGASARWHSQSTKGQSKQCWL